MKLTDAVLAMKEAGVPSPEHDARAIFSELGGIKHYELRDADCCDPAVLDAVARRCAREPLQYILGRVGFFREEYLVAPSVLIPRSDTELLVQTAIDLLPEGSRILDLCTGSGCVAISTVRGVPGSTALAVDLSEEALAVAQKNAALNGVEDRVKMMKADVLCSLPAGESFHCILSNPPYVRDEVYPTLEKEVMQEPKMAFLGGADGLEFYRVIVDKHASLLRDGGFIALEIGYDQGEDLCRLAESAHMDARILKDLSGNDRVAVLVRKK